MKLFKNLNLKTDKPNSNFFVTVNNIAFRSLVGIFFGAFVLFLILALVNNTYDYVNLAFYTGVGFLVFGIGYFVAYLLLKKQKNPDSAENDRMQKKLFVRSLLATAVSYLLFS